MFFFDKLLLFIWKKLQRKLFIPHIISIYTKLLLQINYSFSNYRYYIMIKNFI